MPAGPDSSGIQEIFNIYSSGLRISFFAVPYSYIFKPSRGSTSPVDRRERKCNLFSGTEQDNKYCNFSFILPQHTKLVTSFRRTFFVGRLSFSTTSRKRSKLVSPFNYSLTIQVCVANIPLNYHHRHFHLNIGKGLSCFD